MTKEELSKLKKNSKVIHRGKVCTVSFIDETYFQLKHNGNFVRADRILIGYFYLTRHKEQTKSMILIKY